MAVSQNGSSQLSYQSFPGRVCELIQTHFWNFRFGDPSGGKATQNGDNVLLILQLGADE